MPKFTVAVEHGLKRETAIDRLKKFSDKVRQDSPVELTELQEDWDAEGNLKFAFAAMGMKISGQMETSDSTVQVAGQIPFAAIPFRGQLEKQLSEKIREALADE